MEPKIMIVKCTDKLMWYRHNIGKTFNIHRELKDEYLVRADDGYLNIIKKHDCIPVQESEKKYIKITGCSNSILWYAEGYIGIGGLEVFHETPTAYWVKRRNNNNAWVYKKDAVEQLKGQE